MRLWSAPRHPAVDSPRAASHAVYLTEAGRRLVEKAIAVQHSWIASTLGRMAEPALVALEAKLVALRNIVGEAETPQPAVAPKG
jgi:hypothetical protein